MKIGIGNDHVAVEYKKIITQYIEEKYGYEVINYGTDSTERFNYPVSGEAVANAVVSGEVDKGIVICGTGVGISLAANKVNGIRCVTCSEPYSAKLSREHNNTNMLAFPSYPGIRCPPPASGPNPSHSPDPPRSHPLAPGPL